MRGDEVLQHIHALPEVGRDGIVDGAARGVRHQAADSRHLPHLPQASAGSALHHHQDGVPGHHVLRDLVGNLPRRPGPELSLLGQVLVAGQESHLVVLLGHVVLLLRGLRDLGFFRRDDDGLDPEADPAPGGPVVAEGLDGIQHLHDGRTVDPVVRVVQKASDAFFIQLVVDIAQGRRDDAVEQSPARRGLEEDRRALRRPDVPRVLDDLGLAVLPPVFAASLGTRAPGGVLLEPYGGIDVHRPMVEGREEVLDVREVHSLPLNPRTHVRKVIDPQYDVLRRRDDGTPAGRGEKVVRREHQKPRLGLGLQGQRNVDGHLIAVEVRVERRADHGVEADGLALHQHRLEGLNAQAMQSRGTVQHDGVVLDDLLENPPDLLASPLDDALGALDVRGQAAVHELADDEGLEQLERHLFRKPALIDLELRPDDDDGTPGIVHALAQKVLAEAPLLAAQEVGEALQGTVPRTQHRLAHASVVDEGVHTFLEHALLVSDDDLRSPELLKFLQAIVAVDDPPIEVVQVGRRKAPSVQLHQRTQVRRDDGKDVQDHRLRRGGALSEVLRHLQAFDQLALLLPAALRDLLSQ